MKKNAIIASAIGILILVGISAWYFELLPGTKGQSAAAAEPYVVPPLGDVYTNEKYKFRMPMPQGFAASEFPNEEGPGTTIVLQDEKGNGIQIYITPLEGDVREITADMVTSDIPDMKVTDAQPLEVGNDFKGVAFKSDNEAFGGASRDVWFPFIGNLYQITTYERLDNLLQTMFGTWEFY